MKIKKVPGTNPSKKIPDDDADDSLSEYPLYPDSDDIYHKSKKESNIDPEDVSKIKKPDKSDKTRTNSEKKTFDESSGSDLDVPGSELDDEQENVGIEDEENDYFSIGGDDHNDLDEDKDEL